MVECAALRNNRDRAQAGGGPEALAVDLRRQGRGRLVPAGLIGRLKVPIGRLKVPIGRFKRALRRLVGLIRR